MQQLFTGLLLVV